MAREDEGFSVDALREKIDSLVREGNVRRIIVRNGEGRTVLDIPLTAGFVALLVAPMITAAVSAVALVGGWRLEVERTEPEVVEQPSEEDS